MVRVRAVPRSSGLTVHIDEQRPRDYVISHAVIAAAFGRAAEANLVDALRSEGAIVASLVARDPEVVGHVLFTRAPIRTDDGRMIACASLAPLAVAPAHQRRGIGDALVRAGLTACRARGIAAVVVLGEPAYYGRFGFKVDSARSLRAPWAGPHFQVLSLSEGALDGVTGDVLYPRAFGDVPR